MSKIDLKDAYFSVFYIWILKNVLNSGGKAVYVIFFPTFWLQFSTQGIHKVNENSHFSAEETEHKFGISGKHFDNGILNRWIDIGMGQFNVSVATSRFFIIIEKSVLQTTLKIELLVMEIE